jgi:hypothetical protein
MTIKDPQRLLEIEERRLRKLLEEDSYGPERSVETQSISTVPEEFDEWQEVVNPLEGADEYLDHVGGLYGRTNTRKVEEMLRPLQSNKRFKDDGEYHKFELLYCLDNGISPQMVMCINESTVDGFYQDLEEVGLATDRGMSQKGRSIYNGMSLYRNIWDDRTEGNEGVSRFIDTLVSHSPGEDRRLRTFLALSETYSPLSELSDEMDIARRNIDNWFDYWDDEGLGLFSGEPDGRMLTKKGKKAYLAVAVTAHNLDRHAEDLIE